MIDLHLFLCTSQPLLEFSYGFLLILVHLTPWFKQSSCLGTILPIPSRPDSQLLLTSSPEPNFVGSVGTHGQTYLPQSPVFSCSTIAVSFYIICALDQECFLLSFTLCNKLVFKSCNNAVHICVSYFSFMLLYVCVGAGGRNCMNPESPVEKPKKTHV